VWDGFCWVEVMLSPKSQSHEVGVPVEVSLNWTFMGVRPSVLSTLKAAVTGSKTLMYSALVSVPSSAGLLAVRVTV